jgi:predicted aldo/keto reductase-like oxidoreductase
MVLCRSARREGLYTIFWSFTYERSAFLGTSGLRVSEVFLDAMTFGEECRRVLEAYSEAGGNVIDTAINYRNGESERIDGELLVNSLIYCAYA